MKDRATGLNSPLQSFIFPCVRMANGTFLIGDILSSNQAPYLQSEGLEFEEGLQVWPDDQKQSHSQAMLPICCGW